MDTVNIAELKNKLSLYLQRVRNGQEILVKDRDQPIAKIVPWTMEDSDQQLVQLAKEGKIKLGSQKLLDDEFWSMPAPQISESVLRKAISEERDD